MSLTHALSNAASGLDAASRSVRLVADNVANANTPGHVRRAPDVASRLGGGVLSGAERREEAPALTQRRRLAEAETAAARPQAEALDRIADLAGAIGGADTLASDAVAVVTSMQHAALAPQNDEAAREVIRNAGALADRLNGLNTAIAQERQAADARIASGVDALNGALAEVEALNARIVSAQVGGSGTAALEDRRDAALDSVAALVPLRTVAREGGAIAVFSTRGAVLLDGARAEISFDPTPGITADQTVATGLRIDGREDAAGLLKGGQLAADLTLRDETLVETRNQIAAYSDRLLASLAQAAPDGPALLRKESAAGLLGVDPAYRALDQPAIAALHAEDGQALARTVAALEAGRPSPTDAASDLLVDLRGAANAAERVLVNRGAIAQSARTDESAALGVDTDQQLQALLQYETAYAANARVLSVVDDLLKRLMEI